MLTHTNLACDQQVDTRPKPDGRQVHGGPEMAVYVYPEEHYPFWVGELDRLMAPGMMGENLTVRGVAEEDIHIGDRWRWGEALVEVSKPRQPCKN